MSTINGLYFPAPRILGAVCVACEGAPLVIEAAAQADKVFLQVGPPNAARPSEILWVPPEAYDLVARVFTRLAANRTPAAITVLAGEAVA